MGSYKRTDLPKRPLIPAGPILQVTRSSVSVWIAPRQNATVMPSVGGLNAALSAMPSMSGSLAIKRRTPGSHLRIEPAATPEKQGSGIFGNLALRPKINQSNLRKGRTANGSLTRGAGCFGLSAALQMSSGGRGRS